MTQLLINGLYQTANFALYALLKERFNVVYYTYNISVYATKLGYENSEVATATLCWIDVEPQTEGISNEIAQIRSKAVMIQGIDGVLNVSGIDNGLKITVYSVSGQMVGVARAISNQTSIVTNLRKGEIGIVKVGDKSLKVVMQ